MKPPKSFMKYSNAMQNGAQDHNDGHIVYLEFIDINGKLKKIPEKKSIKQRIKQLVEIEDRSDFQNWVDYTEIFIVSHRRDEMKKYRMERYIKKL